MGKYLGDDGGESFRRGDASTHREGQNHILGLDLGAGAGGFERHIQESDVHGERGGVFKSFTSTNHLFLYGKKEGGWVGGWVGGWEALNGMLRRVASTEREEVYSKDSLSPITWVGRWVGGRVGEEGGLNEVLDMMGGWVNEERV